MVRRLMEGASLLAIAASPLLCSIEGEGGEGGGGDGGAAAGDVDDLDELLTGSSAAADAAAAAAAGDAGAGGGEGEGGEGGDDGKAPDPAEWMKSFSADKKDGALSNQEWLAKAGVKDLDSLAQLARDNIRAVRESGRVKIPGEGASEAEVAAYREAVGVPKEATGYEVAMPEGLEGFELDTAFLSPLQAIAHANNVPAKAFGALAAQFMAAQAETAQADAANAVTERDAVLKEWGADAEARKGEFRRGAEILGLNKAAIQSIQNGFGVKATMNLLARVGSLAGEDFFASGNTREKFGVADGAAAQKQIDAMVNDPATAAKLRAKDPVTVGRYNRLIDAKAAFDEAEARGAKR